MSDTLKQRVRAGIVALAPVLLLVGFILHPYQEDFTDTAEAGDVIAGASARWGWSHILIGLGLSVAILAVFAVRMFLQKAGEDTWSFWAVGLFTVGGGMLTMFVGVEGLAGTLLADAGAGAGGIELFFEEGESWNWLFLLTMAIFSLGILAFGWAVYKSGVLAKNLAITVLVGSVAGAVLNFVPMGWALIAAGVSTLAVFWPLAMALNAAAEQEVTVGAEA